MKKFPLLIFFAFGAFAGLHAQLIHRPGSTNPSNGEMLVPLTGNPVQQADAQHRANQRSIQSIYDTLALPSTGLIDKFDYDSHVPDTLLWADFLVDGGAYVNRTWAIAPINIGVCTFDGLNSVGSPYDSLAATGSTRLCDQLRSRYIDLSTYTPADSVYLSFWYEAQGRGYAPNAQDSFLLQFNIPAWGDPNSANPDAWKTVWYKLGYAPSAVDTNFHIVLLKLDSASYFVKGFTFRFLNYASACGSNDHWHLDEVYLKSNRNMHDTIPGDVNLVYPPSSALTDFWAVPHTHYKPNMMAPSMNVQIRNNDVVSRNVTYWYNVYDESNALIYQYPNAGGAANPGGTPTYASAGYESYAPLANPAVGFAFSQTAVNNDSTTFQIRHVLKENNTTFDTITNLQKFYNYYAYDDGSAEVGYGLYATGSQLAIKFTLPVGITDTLKAVQMYFLPVQDINNLRQRTWTLTVWADQGNQPGTIIYKQRTEHLGYKFETPDRFLTYTIDSGTVVLSGTFYIGWQQQAIDRLYIGYDFNDDHHDKVYFNSTGNWNQSIFAGSPMIRPVFGDSYDATGIQEQVASNGFAMFPNPATDHVTISGLKSGQQYFASVLDISGREVLPAQEVRNDAAMDVSSLSPGIYLVQMRGENNAVIGTQRLIIAQ